MNPEKKIPALLGSAILLFTTFAGVVLTNRQLIFRSQADSGCNPEGLQITNITHNSFDVSFTTQTSCLSTLSINNRTVQNLKNKSKVHYFSLTNLNESTSYPFNLIIGSNTYNKDEYAVKTAKKPTSNTPTSNLAWGRILNPDDSPANEAIVYINIPGASPLSSVTTSNGNWNISLAISFNAALDGWFTPRDGVEEDIVVISADGIVTQVSNTTQSNNPVPDITIGHDSLSPSTKSNNQSGSLGEVTPAAQNANLSISNPDEGETIFALKPDFFGSAPKDSTLSIKVESPEVFSDTVPVDKSGIWHWTPPKNLTPGKHTVTISIPGSSPIVKSFYVSAAESASLAFSSSPSATLVPSTPTPPTVTPSRAPSSIPSPTPTLIKTVTVTLAPTQRTSAPSTESGVPVTGIPAPTIILSFFATLFIGTSLYILKREQK